MYMDSNELSELKGSTVSLSKALEYSDDARVICHAKFPNGLLHANKAWTALTKYEQHEIEGKPLSCLHGPLTDTGRIIQLMHNVTFSGFGSTEVVNYDKNMVPFACRISIQPIISQNCYGEYRISHYMWVLEKNPDFYTAYPIPFLSQEEEEAYDWVLNADSETKHSPLRRNDKSWDDFERPLKQARINKNSVQGEIIRKTDMEQCNEGDERNSEEEEDHQTDSERSDREEKSQEDTIYRVDVVEFLPPLSSNHCPSNTITIDNNTSSTSNSNPLTRFNSETEIITEEANNDNIRRIASSLSLENNHYYEEESKQETDKGVITFGRKMLNASVDSFKEKLLKQQYNSSSVSPPTSLYSNAHGNPNLNRKSTAMKASSSSNSGCRSNYQRHSSSRPDNKSNVYI